MSKDISVIIVSYNTKDITLKCISKLQTALSKSTLQSEIIIVENNSQDGSLEALRKISDSPIKIINNSKNSGYGSANNIGFSQSNGRYILYLNSDVLVPEVAFFDSLIETMDSHPLYGALTIKIQLPSGGIDPASHRGFPTVWRSFCYYAGLERLTAHIPLLNRLFGGYHLTFLPLTTIHQIDSPTGAFFLVRKDLIDVLKGFDEDFFMYGEDIDLAYRIKRLGFLIMYDPTCVALHLKGQSGTQKKDSIEIQKKTHDYFYESMAIFYQKHYEKCYPSWISRLVYAAINYKKNII